MGPLLVVGMGTTAPRALAAPLFAAFLSFDTGSAPASVAIGDLNGDGKPDLAVANYVSNTVSVLLGKGDGSFATKVDYGTGTFPNSVAIGDLNGDGKLDLAVANYGSYTVSVLLGRGDGSFATKVDYATGMGPYSVAIGDLNGDGTPDLVSANYYSNTVSVFLGRGDGTFGARTDYATGSGPASVAIGDLNGDGKLDLAVANGFYDALNNIYSRTVSVLLGNGDGSLAEKTDFVAGAVPQSVTIRDLNGDGKPDLVVANSGYNTISVFLGNGDGSFGPKTDYSTGFHPLSVAVGDLDGDGRPDMVTANAWSSTVWVLLGTGDGSFGMGDEYATGTNPTSVAIGDLNADGKPDLAVANAGANTVSVLLNIGPGIPTPTSLALVDSHAEPGRVVLRWYGAAMAGIPATVYRQTAQAAWTALAVVAGDGMGKVRFEDTQVQPGVRYGYRLGVREGGTERFYGETWITVPAAWTLALATPAPNPATDRLAIGLTLPSVAPARLEVIDVAGRVVASRDVSAQGAGPQTLTFDLAGGWCPGIYLVRLTQGQRSLTARACILH